MESKSPLSMKSIVTELTLLSVGSIHYFGLTSLPVLRVADNLFFVDNIAHLPLLDAALWVLFVEGDDFEFSSIVSSETSLGLVPRSSSTNIYRYPNKRKKKANKRSKQWTPNKKEFNN